MLSPKVLGLGGGGEMTQWAFWIRGFWHLVLLQGWKFNMAAMSLTKTSEGRAIGQSLGVGIEDFDSGFLEIVKFPWVYPPSPHT